jgi:murein DD-endopeptidase MepM/ murein hydrolase activator NlpD
MQLLAPRASAAFIIAAILCANGTATAPAASDHSAQVRSEARNLPIAVDGTATLPTRSPARLSTTASPAGGGRSQGFTWPISPRPAVRRRFEAPRKQWSRGHRGVDLAAAVGQPVLSAGEGVVAFTGVIAGRGVITVRHPDGLRTTYEPVEQRLAAGSRVSRGTRIGVLAPTPGHCVPLTCLHWGAITGTTYRDPLSLLGFGRPILLPLG